MEACAPDTTETQCEATNWLKIGIPPAYRSRAGTLPPQERDCSWLTHCSSDFSAFSA
jgi:hypothetical protein